MGRATVWQTAPQTCFYGGRRKSAIFIITCLLLLASVLGADARTISSRLGSTPADPSPPLKPTPISSNIVPVQVMALPSYGPLSADGAGRLLMLINDGDGYTVMGSSDLGFEPIYKRRASYGVSLAVGSQGQFCAATQTGVDCIDQSGRISHLTHELLTYPLAITIAPNGHIWLLRSTSGTHQGLQLVRIAADGSAVDTILTLRQNIYGFSGNSLATLSDGSVLLPVVENDTPRILRVHPSGDFTRIGDFYDLAGGIVVDSEDALVVNGVKRPQSVQEQRNPQDALLLHAVATTEPSQHLIATLPTVPSGTRLTSNLTLGGDGSLYFIRHQRVLTDTGSAQEWPVLWSADLGRSSSLGPQAQVISFRIPYIERLSNPKVVSSHYVGPLMIAPGQPMVIDGLSFEGKSGEQNVLVGGVPGQVQGWTDDKIIARLPESLVGGEVPVQVAIDHVVSDPEWLVVKTAEIPGWFQIGTPSLKQTLHNNPGIVGYNAHIVIEGVLADGTTVRHVESMDTAGLFHVRLPNGSYTARFSAAYVAGNVQYGQQFEYVGSQHTLVTVPEQSTEFEISDVSPIEVWVPQMLGDPKAGG